MLRSASTHSSYDDSILFLSREGQGVGLSLIMTTATQTNALNYKTLSNYGTRIAYSCNDSGEYMNLFDRCKVEPKDVPGRGLCSLEKHYCGVPDGAVRGGRQGDRPRAEYPRAHCRYERRLCGRVPRPSLKCRPSCA